MVSRRRILSRSRDDLSAPAPPLEDEDDVWYNKDKLYKDHIQEVLDKWTQIDDEIWAKVIVLERNRRVAKAYARAPVLTVNGSDDGFDGFRIGLCGFDNPMRDQRSEELRKHIGQGVKIKMDDAGNILIKRVSKSNVYIKSSGGEDDNAIGNEILKLPGCALEMEKPVKLFDMKKFQSNLNKELRRAYPDRRRLENQCLSIVAFVKSDPSVLECPIWVLIINVVAIDMLKSKLPPGLLAPVQRVVDIKNRPRIPVPDEDPYSVAAGEGTSGGYVSSPRRRSDRPPKLPPRENHYPHDIPKPDYDDIDDAGPMKPFPNSRSSDKIKKDKKYDDPYYCGLRARVPNFVKSMSRESGKRQSVVQEPIPHPAHKKYTQQQQPIPAPSMMMWHSRSYEGGLGDDTHESPYNKVYGRLPIPTRGYIPNQSRTMYIGEWD